MRFIRPPRDPDLDAVIGALATDTGGRKSPMVTGYRPSHDFRVPGELNDGMHECPEVGRVSPGETGRANIWLLDPDRQVGRLFAGFLFSVQEGARVVGNGRILQVLNSRLQRPRPIQFELDGARIASTEDFYDEVSRVLIPGQSWGRNLDALNDILRGGFGTPDEGFQLVWLHHATSRERLGFPETVRQLEKRLTTCHPSNVAAVREEIALARRGVGATVFESVVDIIRDHGSGGAQAADQVHLVLQ
jgi:RNAse (barnase) inhibitor barstar